jgi:nucleotide-binding universal stress UspA family protein
MFNNILVPSDLSEKSIKALEIALDMADKGDSMITFLHIIERIEDPDEDELKSFYDRLASRARLKMKEMVSPYAKRKTRIDNEIIFGNRVGEIVDFASKHAIDLIVLSSHKLKKADAVMDWATISYKVGILAPCPVMMVK